MKMTLPVVRLQPLWHSKHQNPHPQKTEGGAPPSHYSPMNYRSGILSSHAALKRKERTAPPGHPSGLCPREQGGVRMRRKLSDQEFHALYCPVKNAKSALFLVGCFSVLAFVSWKGLHKPPEHPSLFELLFAILVFAMLAKSLVAFTCFRERLVF